MSGDFLGLQLNIRAKMLVISSSGVNFIPSRHHAHGSAVGDFGIADFAQLFGGQTVTSSADVALTLAQLKTQSSFNFSRGRDASSVDLLEASQNNSSAIGIFQFVTNDGSNEDTLTVSVRADRLAYLAHTKQNNPTGQYERIGFTFATGAMTIKAGRVNLAEVAMAHELALRKAEKMVVLGIAQEVGTSIGIIRNMF